MNISKTKTNKKHANSEKNVHAILFPKNHFNYFRTKSNEPGILLLIVKSHPSLRRQEYVLYLCFVWNATRHHQQILT